MRRTREQTRLSRLEEAPATVTDIARASSVVPGKAVKRELRATAAVMKKEEPVVAVEKKKPLKVKTESDAKAKAAAKTATTVKSESKEMAEYERKRLENIQRNLEFMRSMGVSTVRVCSRLLSMGSLLLLWVDNH